MKYTLSAAAVLGIVSAAVCGAPANASIVTYSGTDNSAPTSGPFPNSAAAQTAFIAAAGALGPLNTITFENLPTGYYSPIAAAPGVKINWSSPAPFGYSGIMSGSLFPGSNVYGFNTTPGGSKWFGFAGGSATFNFAQGTQSFGLYLTGLQTVFTSPGDLTITFNDGASETLTLPVTANGGAEYFGFTDAGIEITSITITNLTDDAWGVDDVTYNTNTAPVPEPASLLLIGGGLAGIGALRRRKKAKA